MSDFSPEELAIIDRNLAKAGIPDLFRDKTFDDVEIAGLKGARDLAAAVKLCRRYVDTFGRELPRGLLFTGRHGAGKTLLATITLMGVMRRWRVWGRFADTTALLARLQASIDRREDEETEAEIMEHYAMAPIALFDELGSRRPTAYTEDALYLLLGARYAARLPTLFTTNYPLAGRGSLAGRIGERLTSRLWEMCEGGIVVLDKQDDYRKRAKPLTTSKKKPYTTE